MCRRQRGICCKKSNQTKRATFHLLSVSCDVDQWIKNLTRKNYFCSQLFHQAPVQERQKSLYDQFKFRCSCIACLNNYPIEVDLKKCDISFVDPDTSSCKSIHEAISTFKENCRYIDKNFEHHPCYEVCRLMQANSRLLHYIAK